MPKIAELPEAILQFKEALRLDPTNTLAKKYLDTATANQARGQ